jgi:large subunit ribosomal protein L17
VTLDTAQCFKTTIVMRHGDKINNLGRTTAHRKALLSNLACQLIQHKRITTTLAKAKALRVYVEPMVTKSKTDSVNNRRLVFAKLQDKEAIKELFGVISDKVASRPGGYTRIIKLQHRMGDNADMAMIELVDFNTIYTKEAKVATAKKTRRSRGGATAAKATATTEAAPVTEAPATETPATEEGAAE